MKFWKPILLTSTLLASIIGTTVITSCEPNSCDGINCLNGGSCGNGACNCPSGYEGVNCETPKRNRFLGSYAGYTTMDNSTGGPAGGPGAPVIDTVIITPANRGVLSVDVYYKGMFPKVIMGYVSVNESAYSIIVLNNDSSKAGAKEYLRNFDITLQSKNLKIHTYEYERTNADDTFSHWYEFNGTRYK